MARYAYLAFDIAISLSMVFAALRLPSFWRQWRGMLLGLSIVSMPFAIWDVLAAHWGHWHFSAAYTMQWRLLGLPAEEILFFVVVPLACMVVWESLRRVRDGPIVSVPLAHTGLYTACALVLLGTLLARGRGYTQLALLAGAITCAVLSWFPGWVVTRRFLLFQFCSFSLFAICNTYLTALPIITYSTVATTGWRVGTIPVEDFLYNFALTNLFLVVFHYTGRQTSQSAV